MRIAKVKALAISAPKKKIYKVGQEVNENMFPQGRFDELLKGGYITLTGETSEPAVPLSSETTTVTLSDDANVAQPSPDSAENVEPGKKVELPVDDKLDTIEDPDDVTVKEIKVELTKLNVEYPKNATKAELYELYRINKEKA